MRRILWRAMEKGTIAICFVEAALRAVRARGGDAEALLVQVGIPPSLLQTAAARVSAARYGALWRLIAQTLGDEMFGLDARRVKPGSFAMLCRTVIHCGTLQRALNRCSRFYDLLLDDVSIAVSRHGDTARLTLHERNAPRGCPQRVFAHEGLLIILHGLACWLVGRRIPITLAEFGYPRARPQRRVPDQVQQRARVLPAGHVDCVRCVLSRAARRAGRAGHEGVPAHDPREHPGQVQEHQRPDREDPRALAPGAARRAARPRDPGAASCYTTPATLRRRLQEEGESYQSIKDQLRRDLAITYLSDSRAKRHGYRPRAGLCRTERLPSSVQEMDRSVARRAPPKLGALREPLIPPLRKPHTFPAV